LAAGDAVNLEPSVTPTTLLGGHLVQGHVDGVGVVVNVIRSDAETRVTVRPPADLMRYMVPKGSVAVDGVSLTLADVGQDDFTVALIPTTLAITTLGSVRAGSRVNVEADQLVKAVARLLNRADL